MTSRKIAIVGSSGMGRSTCAKIFGPLEDAEMDRHFRTNVCPPDYVTVMDWMLDGTPAGVIDVSTHINMPSAMRDAKRRGVHPERFGRILFILLDNSDASEHRRNLESPNAAGHRRHPDFVANALKNSGIVREACSGLADVTIDAAGRTLESVIEEIDGHRRRFLY